MKKRKNNFKKVSYFSKTPIFPRFSFLLITVIFIIGFATFTINYFSHSNVIQFFCSLLFLTMSIYFIKKWILIRRKYNGSPFKKLKWFIKENKLYEEEIYEVGINENGRVKKKKVVVNSAYFLYKTTENDELIIRALKRADRFSDKANSYDTLLSALFGLSLYKKFDDVQNCDYVFELVPDKRIVVSNSNRNTNNYKIQITSKINWEIGSPPHILLSGPTGSGKTSLVNTLILDYLSKGAKFFIADPKAADLAMIGRIIDKEHTATTENEIAKLLREANEEMERRYKEWFAEKESFGKTWKDIDGAKPFMVVFDEYAAFTAVSSPKVVKEVQGYLFNLILKSRQVGGEICILLQRPDASILNGSIRDNFGVRIGLSNMTDDGRRMLFGSTDVEYKSIREMGGGYILVDGQNSNLPVYFETPLIPRDYNFLEELQNIVNQTHPTATTKAIEIGRQTP